MSRTDTVASPTPPPVYMFKLSVQKDAVAPILSMSYKDINVIRRRTENPLWRQLWKRSWPWCRWQTWPPFLALQPSLPLEIGKSGNSPRFQKKIMKMKARRLTCAWCTYDMQIGAKQTIAKRSPIVDSFLASASPIRASLLTCKITSLSFCRFLFTVWQKESSWRPVPSLFDQDCANSPPRH